MSTYLPNKISLFVKINKHPLILLLFGFSITLHYICLGSLKSKKHELAEIRTSIELLKTLPLPEDRKSENSCDTIKEIVATLDHQEISYGSMSSTELDISITLQNQSFDKTLSLLQVLAEKHPCVDIEQLNIYANTDTPTGEISGSMKFINKPD